MQKYRIEIMRRLRSFNDNAIPDDASIESLKARRMAVAKQMLGKLGDEANIEPPFFCGWGCNTFVGDGAYMNRKYFSPFRSSFVFYSLFIVSQYTTMHQSLSATESSSARTSLFVPAPMMSIRLFVKRLVAPSLTLLGLKMIAGLVPASRFAQV
jgi:hypothetical protein